MPKHPATQHHMNAGDSHLGAAKHHYTAAVHHEAGEHEKAKEHGSKA